MNLAKIGNVKMKLPEEIKIDLLGCLKYMVKHLKQVRRKKIIMYSFWLSLVTGLAYFCLDKNLTILLIFIFALSILLYNVHYWVNMFMFGLYTKIKNWYKKKTTR